MMTITFFDTEEELLELTGILRRDDLWDADFDLDDWDFGFMCQDEWHSYWDGNCSHYYEEWMLNHMDNHCVGYRHVEYRGKHYYMAYHS